MFKKIIFTILIIYLSLLYLPSNTYGNNNDFYYYRGIITEILKEDKIVYEDLNQIEIYKKLEVEYKDENKKIRTAEVEVVGLEQFSKIDYNIGDRVILSSYQYDEDTTSYAIISSDRQNTLTILFICFVIIAFLISSKRTAGSLLGLIFSFFIIFKFLIPNILNGANPIFLSIISAIFIIPVSFSLSHGINPKTKTAIFSTIIALIITGVLGSIFMYLSKITGQGLEEATFVSTYINQNIKIEGLLLAGIIIGTLGVLDDVTVSQASIVQQISEVGKKLTRTEIFMRAMNVGKDHMASMINTLVLVYAGASMPLLIIFTNSNLPLNYILSMEVITIEIIRTLVGTIGLISAIPITTFLATIVFTHTSKP